MCSRPSRAREDRTSACSRRPTRSHTPRTRQRPYSAPHPRCIRPARSCRLRRRTVRRCTGRTSRHTHRRRTSSPGSSACIRPDTRSRRTSGPPRDTSRTCRRIRRPRTPSTCSQECKLRCSSSSHRTARLEGTCRTSRHSHRHHTPSPSRPGCTRRRSSPRRPSAGAGFRSGEGGTRTRGEQRPARVWRASPPAHTPTESSVPRSIGGPPTGPARGERRRAARTARNRGSP